MTQILQGDRIGRTARLAVACSASIFDDRREKLLLVQRVDNHQWCMPGGGMDAGESVAEACMREVYEETGLEAEVVRLIGIYTSPHQIVAYSDGQNFQYVSMSFEAKAVGGTLSLSEETIAFGYFSRPEIAQLDLIADQVVRVADAFADQETTFIR